MDGLIYKDDEALECYSKVIEINPENSLAWNFKANFLSENNYSEEEILKCYNKAIELESSNDVYWFNKGSFLCQINKIKEALYCFDKSIELNDNSDAYYEKAKIYIKTNQNLLAIEYIEKALINTEKDSWIRTFVQNDPIFKNLWEYEEFRKAIK